jgi:hypothetical protein
MLNLKQKTYNLKTPQIKYPRYPKVMTLVHIFFLLKLVFSHGHLDSNSAIISENIAIHYFPQFFYVCNKNISDIKWTFLYLYRESKKAWAINSFQRNLFMIWPILNRKINFWFHEKVIKFSCPLSCSFVANSKVLRSFVTLWHSLKKCLKKS